MKIKLVFGRLIWITLLGITCLYATVVSAHADGLNPSQQIENLSITRMAPTERALGEKIWVIILIENTGTETVEFQFIEQLGNAEFDPAYALATLVDDPGYGMPPPIPSTTEGFKRWRYEWKVRLPGGHKTHLTYWLIPKNVGVYVISPAKLVLDEQSYPINSWTIQVLCRIDNACSAGQGENVLTCPEDCSAGQADNICQAVLDGVMDPDCEEGVDPDAAQPAEPAQTSVPTETVLPAEEKVKFNPAICPAAVVLFGLTLLFQAFRHMWGWLMYL